MKLAEFLLARIAEDESLAERSLQVGDRGAALVSIGRPDAPPVLLLHPTRVLAECEAKRRIIDMVLVKGKYRSEDYRLGVGATEDLLRLLALPYSGHPDFNPDWKVS